MRPGVGAWQCHDPTWSSWNLYQICKMPLQIAPHPKSLSQRERDFDLLPSPIGRRAGDEGFIVSPYFRELKFKDLSQATPRGNLE
jgi:hypothetical protein